MKNKNIKNKSQKCGRWLFLHSRFSKIFRGGDPPDPPFKGNISIKPSKSFFHNNCRRLKSPSPLKQYTRNLSLGYTEIEKRRRALGQALFCVICNWAVCDSCIVSSWALLIFLAHLSRRLTRWAYRMGLEPASVRPCVRVCVHTFKHEYLWDRLADGNQILYEASLGWGKGCIRFWCRSDQNSGFHGNR